MNKIKCPKCGEENNLMLHEWMGAYDGCLTIECRTCKKHFHRTNLKEIVRTEQPVEYGPVFFTTKGGERFKNLTKI